MVGFPGETEADFKELLTFIKAVKFDNMGAFTYSAQDGTPAARMVDQVTEEIKENITIDRITVKLIKYPSFH